MRHADVRYTTIDRSPARSSDLLSCYPSHKRSFVSDTQDLENLDNVHTSDDHSSVTRGKCHLGDIQEALAGTFCGQKMDL